MDSRIIQQALNRISRKSQDSKLSTPDIDFSKEAEIYRSRVFEIEPNFDVNKANKKVLNAIFGWIWKLDDCNILGLDYNKGLWFYGPIGVGKTMMLLAMRRYMNSVTSRYRFMKEDYRLKSWLKSASELSNIYASGGQEELIKYTADDVNLIIDELGREPIPASYYGTKMNVAQFILQLRYDHRRTSITHVTTNISLEDIENLYGDYVADRCKELFNFVEVKGESLR